MGRAAEASDLWNRIWFTLGALAIYRLGTYVLLPGIDPQIYDTGVMFSGGGFPRFTIFTLGIGPYVFIAFWALILSVGWRRVAKLKRRGAAGRRALGRYILVGTVAVAALEAYEIAIWLEGIGRAGRSPVIDAGPLFRTTTVVTLTGGTVFLVWLAEQITARGIGNGVAMIIFSDIVARMPAAFGSLLELARAGQLSGSFVALFLAIAAGVVALIVLMETAQRRVLVQYRPRLVGTRMFEGEGTHLRFKLNTAGIIPPIFASWLLLLPATFASFSAATSDEGGLVAWINIYLRHGSPLYIGLYAALIIFLCFFYTAIVFSPKEAAADLGKYGGTIPGCDPGQPTADHLDGVLTRITLIGSLYLVPICLLPEILVSQYAVPFYFGGSSSLVAVCIALDVVRQMEAIVKGA